MVVVNHTSSLRGPEELLVLLLTVSGFRVAGRSGREARLVATLASRFLAGFGRGWLLVFCVYAGVASLVARRRSNPLRTT